MTVLLSEVGRRGRLNLTFSSRRGRTVIRDAYCEVPFKITRLHESLSHEMAHLILMHSTAGLFGGDTIDCSIHVESGARVRITQQSATKAHPSGGRTAIQKNQIRVEDGGELHLLLDPVIPFSGARVQQTTSIDVVSGARLRFWEGLMAGRVGSGEAWQFEEFNSETSLRVNGRPCYVERFRLMPGEEPPNTAWTMRDARYLATGLCFDERAADFADRLHELLSGKGVGIDTPAPRFAVARIVAAHGPEYHRYRSIFASILSSGE